MNILEYYRHYETLSDKDYYCPCGEDLEVDCEAIDENDNTICHDCEVK